MPRIRPANHHLGGVSASLLGFQGDIGGYLMANGKEEPAWVADVAIARCLAYLCLRNSSAVDRPMLEQAEFLQKLGLRLEDAAGVLGSSVESLKALARQQTKRKGGGRGKR